MIQTTRAQIINEDPSNLLQARHENDLIHTMLEMWGSISKPLRHSIPLVQSIRSNKGGDWNGLQMDRNLPKSRFQINLPKHPMLPNNSNDIFYVSQWCGIMDSLTVRALVINY